MAFGRKFHPFYFVGVSVLTASIVFQRMAGHINHGDFVAGMLSGVSLGFLLLALFYQKRRPSN